MNVKLRVPIVNTYFEKSLCRVLHILLDECSHSCERIFMWRKEDVIEKLKQDQGARSLRDYAEVLGTSAGYLSDVYNNRREPGTELLDHLNIEKTVTVTYAPKPPKKWRK